MAANPGTADVSDTPRNRDTTAAPSLSPAILMHDPRTGPRPVASFHFLLEQRS